MTAAKTPILRIEAIDQFQNPPNGRAVALIGPKWAPTSRKRGTRLTKCQEKSYFMQ